MPELILTTDKWLSQLMLDVAEQMPTLCANLKNDPAFQFAERAVVRVESMAARVGNVDAYRKFVAERRKERFAVLRGPFNLDAVGQLPEYAAYRSTYIDELRVEAAAKQWRGVVDPTTRSLAECRPTAQETADALDNWNAKNAFASARFAGAKLRFGSLRLELHHLYEEWLSPGGFRSHGLGRSVTSFSRSIKQTDLYFALVDTSARSLELGSADFAVSLQTREFPQTTTRWQFSVSAYYLPYDISQLCGSVVRFDPSMVAALYLAAYCNAQIAIHFAELIQGAVDRYCVVS